LDPLVAVRALSEVENAALPAVYRTPSKAQLPAALISLFLQEDTQMRAMSVLIKINFFMIGQ
jgi:hypothetical protein